MTFVNPEPLALFADVIAAGEGEVAGSAISSTRCGETARSRRAAARARRASAASTSRRSTTSRYDGRRHDRGVRCRSPAPARRRSVQKAAVKTTDALDPPATSIFTPDTEFGSRFLIEVVRGCANLCRFCWAGYNYLPVRPFPDRSHPRARRATRGRTRQRAGLVSIALCDHPDIERILTRPARHGLLDQPGLAAARRSDAEPIVPLLRESGERSITIAPETGSDRLRRVINKTVTNEEILDARRADLRQRHREPEALLHDRPARPRPTTTWSAIRDLTLADARRHAAARAAPRGRIGRIVGSVNPLIPKPGTAYQWLPMEDPAMTERKSKRLRAAARRHRQRLLQHQVGAAFVLPGAAVARRSPRRAGDRSGRAQRRQLARRRRRSRRRRRLLHLSRPLARRRPAVGHHRRRHEGGVLPGGVRQGAARGMDAAAEAAEREPAASCPVLAVASGAASGVDRRSLRAPRTPAGSDRESGPAPWHRRHRPEQREAAPLAVDRVLARRERDVAAVPVLRSQIAKPISFRPSSGPSVKCSSASASLPGGLPLSFGTNLDGHDVSRCCARPAPLVAPSRHRKPEAGRVGAGDVRGS